MRSVKLNSTPEKDINVLHIITRLIRGGADENTVTTVREINSKRYKVDLMVGGDSDFKLLNDLKDINIICISHLKRGIGLSNFVALVQIFRLIKRNNYQIVHTHTAMAGFIGRLAAKVAGVPIIVHTIHGITFHQFLPSILRKLYILIERIAGLATDVFITVGDDVKNKYLREKIGNPEKYITIRSGFDYSDYTHALEKRNQLKQKFKNEFDISERDIVFGTVSRIEPRKGHIYLIEAAQKVVKKIPQTRFFIIGDGYYRSFLERKVREKGLDKNVVFVGHRQNIAELMVCLDVFVLTSLWEGLPRVLVQAALLGKPIVTFDIEGANEIIQNNVNGFIVPTKDKDILADRLIYLAKNPETITQFGEKSSLQINGLWKKEVMVEEINKVYENLISRKVLPE